MSLELEFFLNKEDLMSKIYDKKDSYFIIGYKTKGIKFFSLDWKAKYFQKRFKFLFPDKYKPLKHRNTIAFQFSRSIKKEQSWPHLTQKRSKAVKFSLLDWKEIYMQKRCESFCPDNHLNTYIHIHFTFNFHDSILSKKHRLFNSLSTFSESQRKYNVPLFLHFQSDAQLACPNRFVGATVLCGEGEGGRSPFIRYPFPRIDS